MVFNVWALKRRIWLQYSREDGNEGVIPCLLCSPTPGESRILIYLWFIVWQKTIHLEIFQVWIWVILWKWIFFCFSKIVEILIKYYCGFAKKCLKVIRSSLISTEIFVNCVDSRKLDILKMAYTMYISNPNKKKTINMLRIYKIFRHWENFGEMFE